MSKQPAPCTKCGGPRTGSESRCAPCRRAEYTPTKCRDCDAVKDKGAQRCAACKAAEAAALRECKSCGSRIGKGVRLFCPPCRVAVDLGKREYYGVKRSTSYHMRHAAKLCVRCGNHPQRENARVCSACAHEMREDHYLKKYGITVAEYEAMSIAQGGCCAVCGRKSGAGRKKLHVDHDHRNGRIRGLLCQPCNVAIGLLSEVPDTLLAAVKYLTSASEEERAALPHTEKPNGYGNYSIGRKK